MDLARPLMHAVSDSYGVTVYLSKVVGPCSQLLLDWVGAALRTDLYLTVGRQFPGPRGASGVIMAAFGNTSEAELERLFAQVAWYQKPPFPEFLARVQEARKVGLRGRSREYSGHHTGCRAGLLTVMGAAARPDRGTLARRSQRRHRAAQPGDAIGGGPAFRKRPIAASWVI